MAEETEYNDELPEGYRWEDLIQKEGIELTNFYRKLLLHLGTESTGKIQKIYNNAQTSINEPASLRKIIKNIDELDWFEAKEEGLGEMYEGLLEKNASEKNRCRTILHPSPTY
ncbi:hypothetical protein PJW08_06475 [Tenacibaculum finnmarkense]|nr:hypothetical protein PJW08_06475 [Tenacibaculum finnmarkense]